MKIQRFSLSAVGGTFDHFHVGHEVLITTAGEQSKHLIIGVTTDEFALQHKVHTDALESYEVRTSFVREYCNNNGYSCEIVPIDSTSGTAHTNPDFEALFYTEEVQNNAQSINDLRVQSGLKPLSLVEVPLSLTKDSRKISSELIRGGEINRKGVVYKLLFKKNIKISPLQRTLLAKPLGTFLDGKEPTKRLKKIVVGDATLGQFQDNGWSFDTAIIDGKIQRREYKPLVIAAELIDLVVVNPPGHITTMLIEGLNLALRKSLDYIYVDGEEDLAAIVAILLLPLGSAVYYGQPDKGVIEWVATEEQKQAAYQILSNP